MTRHPDRPSLWRRSRSFLESGVWELGRGESLPSWKAGILRVLRVLLITVRGFAHDNCLMRAGSLTYVTIFSLVPLLAVSFAVAKGLGADQALQERFLEPFLDETFGPARLAEPEPRARAAAAREAAENAGKERAGEAAEAAEAADAAQAAAEEAAEKAGEAAEKAEEAVEAALEAAGVPPSAGTAEEAQPPVGQQLRRVIDKVFDFVRGTNFTSLGTFSFAFLLYCIVKLLGATEKTLNLIWGVRTTRSFTRRLTNYLAIVVMTPMVVLTATGITALLEGSTYQVIRDRLGFDLEHGAVLALLPFLVVSAGMTFLYMALPNTRVRVGSAALGGIVGGFLWQLGQIGHVEFQLGVARMNAIYSGFAIVPLFLLWLYVNWAVLLLGAEVAHAHQSEPVQTTVAATGGVDQRLRERLALRLALRVVDAFLGGRAAPSADDLASAIGLAPRLVSKILARLVEGGVVVRTDEDSGERFVPARDPELLRVSCVLDAVRSRAETKEPPAHGRLDEGADQAFALLRAAAEDSPHNKTLATLARSAGERDRPGELGDVATVG